MKTIAGLLSLSMGVYFSAYAGRLIPLRESGYTGLFRLLDAVFEIGPYASGALLLVVGVVLSARGSHGKWRTVAALVSVTCVALLPLLIHVWMFRWTYYAGTPPRRAFWGPLTRGEWGTFGLGLTLLTVGFYLLFAVRASQR